MTTTTPTKHVFLRAVIGLRTLAVFLAPITAALLLTSPSGKALAWQPGGRSPATPRGGVNLWRMG
jgi:hypothetical protein